MARVFLINPKTDEVVRTPLLSFLYLAASLRRAGHEVGVVPGDRALQDRMDVDMLNHCFVPCSGMINSTCAPGNAGRPSFSGTSSAQDGTMLISAVPLRIEIFPSQRLM